MRAEDNGNVLVCMQNLLSMVKTECPLARDKGVDARLIDQAAVNFEDLDEDVTDLIANYEPRAKADGLSVTYDDDGNFAITVNTSPEGGDEDGI